MNHQKPYTESAITFRDSLLKRLQYLSLVWKLYQVTGLHFDLPWRGWISSPLAALAPFIPGVVPRMALDPDELDNLSPAKLVLLEVALIREALDAGPQQYPYLAKRCQVPRLFAMTRNISQDGNWLPMLLEKAFPDTQTPIEEAVLNPVIPNDDVRRASQQRQNGDSITRIPERERQRQHRHTWYEVEQRLGEGAFGQVERVRDKWTAEIYARKTIHFRPNTKEACLKEVRIMQRLHHPHMVELISMSVVGRRLEMLMLPVADEDLDHYLTRFGDQAGPPDGGALLRSWFECLASGLAYLHEACIRHKDIKPRNILIKGSNVLYTDFGIAREFVDPQFHSTTGLQRGTLMYAAPELAQYDRRNPSADVFSLGCVYIEMLTCLSSKTLGQFREHRTDDDGNQAYYANIDRVLEWSLRLEESLADPSLLHVFNCIPKVLQPDAAQRPKADEIASGPRCCTHPKKSVWDSYFSMFTANILYPISLALIIISAMRALSWGFLRISFDSVPVDIHPTSRKVSVYLRPEIGGSLPPVPIILLLLALWSFLLAIRSLHFFFHIYLKAKINTLSQSHLI